MGIKKRAFSPVSPVKPIQANGSIASFNNEKLSGALLCGEQRRHLGNILLSQPGHAHLVRSIIMTIRLYEHNFRAF